mgnify:CR=1 FL=1
MISKEEVEKTLISKYESGLMQTRLLLEIRDLLLEIRDRLNKEEAK